MRPVGAVFGVGARVADRHERVRKLGSNDCDSGFWCGFGRALVKRNGQRDNDVRE